MDRPVPDSALRAAARAILVRHWLDPYHLELGVHRGVVRLRGTLRHTGRLEKTAPDRALVEVLEGELRRLRGVRHVHLHLDNVWELAAPASPEPTKPGAPERKEPRVHVYDLREVRGEPPAESEAEPSPEARPGTTERLGAR